jgi:glycosyltransferase involved in cell wall biosynthesis
MSAEPKISVVMPVHNGAAWLAEAIKSVLAQTLTGFELLVVDDGSTDASPDIAAAFSNHDSRVRSIRLPRRQGLISALNTALGLVRAELIARLDADDAALPGRFAAQARYFAERPALVLLGTAAERIDEVGRSIGYMRPATDPEQLRQILQKKGNPFIHSSIMMRTPMVRKLGGYREPFLGAEDFDLWLRMCEHGGITNLAEPLVRYRIHGGNVRTRLPVRQCFSTRLALASADLRRTNGFDPADRLTGPPDWWAPQAVRDFYADTAYIARFLDLADPDTLAAHLSDEIHLPSVRQILELSHAEKKLSQKSTINLLRAHRRPAGLSLHRLALMLATLLIGRALYRQTARMLPRLPLARRSIAQTTDSA